MFATSPLLSPLSPLSPSSSVSRRRFRVTREGVAAILVLAALCAANKGALAQGKSSLGVLRIVRQVQVTRDAVAAPGSGAAFVDARDREAVFAGEGVRTLKRSQAEVDFTDHSVLRVNERTDIVVQDTAALRNIQINNGAVWIRVARGIRTQVETPSATAVARGTVFTVTVAPNGGGTTLLVLEGVVDFIVAGGKTVSVHPGETITIGRDGVLPDAPIRLSAAQLPVEFGGALRGWWDTIAGDVGVITLPGNEALLPLRVSPISEAIQQIAAAGPARTGTTSRDYFLPSATDRQLFFTTANTTLRTDWSQYLQNPTAFLSAAGGNSLATLGLNETQIAALQSLQINTVGDAVQTYAANAASAGVTVNFERRTRAAYQPGSLSGTPDYSYRLLDRNETSLAFAGVGAAAALIADARKLSGIPTPTFSGQLFGFGADSSLTGERGRIDGAFGQTRYHLESNLVQLLSGGGNNRNYGRLDSVLYVEHPVGENVSLFAGRRRFFEGPVFQNEVLSQLIADRFTGAGATVKSGPFGFTGAYLYDSNSDARGAQNGVLGSAQMKGYGGTVGVQYLRVPKLSGGGDGVTGSLTYPLVRNVLDFYGEAGRSPDGATIQTYGAYFPRLFQRTDTDLFAEYGSHEGVGRAFSLIGSRNIGEAFNVRAYVSLRNGTDNVQAGLAGIFRFSTK